MHTCVNQMQSKICSKDEQSFCCRPQTWQTRTPIEMAMSPPRVFITGCVFHPDSALLPSLWDGCLGQRRMFSQHLHERKYFHFCVNHESSGSRQGQRKLISDINTELNCLFSHSKPSGLAGDVDGGVERGLRCKLSRVTQRRKTFVIDR